MTGLQTMSATKSTRRNHLGGSSLWSTKDACENLPRVLRYATTSLHTQPTVTVLSARPVNFANTAATTATVSSNVTPPDVGVTPTGAVAFQHGNNFAGTVLAAYGPLMLTCGTARWAHLRVATAGNQYLFAVSTPDDTGTFVASTSTEFSEVVTSP